ncbi:MAG TPA: carbon starvation protein A [Deltaproteobacteria bacterium]|nr:carbon starvation protein A [Deltaproteobacteria bacterium]
MNSALIALTAFLAYLLAYRFYGAFLSRRIFGVDPDRRPPAHLYRDGVDFVPTGRHILFGHHFTSIAGAAPIVGPAIAVIWGWLPALVWVIAGSIFMGAVHDLGALLVSARHRGRSIGEVSRTLIGPRARGLFLLLIFFALLIVIAVFCLVIAVLFKSYPSTVLPVLVSIPVAVALGRRIKGRRGGALAPSLVAVAILYASVAAGLYLPVTMPPLIMGSDILTWVVVLLVYAYVASTLPVWVLLQPRDYINSHQLFIGLALLYLGVFVVRPDMVAPAVNPAPTGAPLLFPFLFITVACGAISGFHSLVCSGTTVKQLDSEADIQFIGYGSMLGEGLLAVMAILACTAGFASTEAWSAHYASWSAAQGLGAKVGAFVEGGARFLAGVGIGREFATALVAVLVISFAATTLDSATRIQRYVVSEIAEDYGFDALSGRHSATMIAVVSAFMLSMINGGKGGLILWPLFGSVNQLLAVLSLLTVTMYLVRERRPAIYTIVPMVFMMCVTAWAMAVNLRDFVSNGRWLLVTLGVGIFLLEVWLVAEAAAALRTFRSEPVLLSFLEKKKVSKEKTDDFAGL